MRSLLIVLDSVGCGEAPDAAAFGDEGANTLQHLFDAHPGEELPALFSLGLWKIVTGDVLDHRSRNTRANWGRMREVSKGKDTTTGHWEMAGVQQKEAFGVFSQFPRELLEPIERQGSVQFLGNYPQSGTVILEELGAEHLKTGRPILYTSADSVLQIAAHEDVLPLNKLYDLCRIARRQADRFRIGRVIARPFTGKPGAFQRTSGRHDFSMVPPRTILNALEENGLSVEGIGKISDIFAGSGLTASHPTASNAEGMATIEEVWSDFDEGLVFANLVDFDMLYGHRRDPAGYWKALVEFDRWLGGFIEKLDEDDLVILTADHGNDPTWKGTDHTREEVPLMVLHGGHARPLGTRRSFADVAATLSDFFQLHESWPGRSFLSGIRSHARSVLH